MVQHVRARVGFGATLSSKIVGLGFGAEPRRLILVFWEHEKAHDSHEKIIQKLELWLRVLENKILSYLHTLLGFQPREI